MMQWPELCVSVVLALSLSPAAGFLTSNPFLSQPQQPTHSSAAAAAVAAHSRRPAPRLLLSRPPSAVLLRPRRSRIHSLSADSAAGSPTRAAGFSSVQSLVGVVGQRRMLARSNTVLELAASRGSNGLGEEGGSGGADSDKGGGWRQRMVRTIVSVVLRIRAVAAGLGAMLGLGRWTKSSSSNQSLFSSASGKKKAAAGKSRGRRATALSRLFRKRTATLLLVMLFVLAMGFRSAGTPAVTEVPMSTFMQLMEGKRGADVVESVRVSKTGTMFFKMNGKECYTLPLRVSKEVFKALCNSGIPFRASKSPPGLSFIFPVVYLLAVYYFIIKRGQGSMVGSTGKLASSTELDTSLTFGDVAGVDQAKSQVQELVSMIKNPAPFIAAGARLPSGLLMVGPPGTGKTLMARVMAAEAGVPFYYCSGSDFVEMYVGRGAARVRKLFVKAGKTAPCIIFLDELDALGKERSGTGGRQTNDEAEQTLNQLLACMDGLDTNNNGVMVIAATNRYEVLDNALTRPGRFDRIVRVDVPDTAGREAILKVHTRKMKLENVDVLRAVAELTPGLAGAELATIANEAAISAARRGSQQLLETDFLESVTNFYVSRKKGVAGLQNMFKGMLT
ncbi:unnamed protein product [Ectocarpus sp. 12 AP-2014]